MIFWDDRVMARGYRPVPRDQAFLLPPDMRDWLPADHPVHLVIEVVDRHLDTGAVHAARRTGGAGAAGYDPDMLTALLVWAYANRVTSSRRIEGLCRTDIAFRVICAGDVPDHVTIARFRAGLGEAAGALFDQVLMLCARLGMGRLGLVALDGMKIAASASASANRTEETLRKLAAQIAAEHAATDAAEDALFGPASRGDEVPAELADPRTRGERITAALAGLQAARQAADAQRDAAADAYLQAAATGRPGRGSRPAAADVAAAQLRLDQVTAARHATTAGWEKRNAEHLAATGKGMRSRKPVPASDHSAVKHAAAMVDRAKARAAAAERKAAEKAAARKGPGPVRNITDPHSRLMPVRGGGFIQGYNTQNVTSEDGLIIATELTASPTDVAWFEPMAGAAQDAAARITAGRPASPDADGQIGLLLADAGYLSEHNLTLDGPDRLIATGRQHHVEQAASGRQPAGGWHRTGPATTAMAARLATSEGIAAYRHRGHIGERPHGHIKHNMAFRQLSVRGIPRAAAEWKLACAVHNLFKAITAGHLTTTALAALTSC
jgi:transposase